MWRGQMSYQICVTQDVCPIGTSMDVHPWSCLPAFCSHTVQHNDNFRRQYITPFYLHIICPQVNCLHCSVECIQPPSRIKQTLGIVTDQIQQCFKFQQTTAFGRTKSDAEGVRCLVLLVFIALFFCISKSSMMKLKEGVLIWKYRRTQSTINSMCCNCNGLRNSILVLDTQTLNMVVGYRQL